MKWFRFYSEAIHEPKVLLLTLSERWIWVVALSLANDGKPRGVLPSLRMFAAAMRVSERKAQEYLDKLIDVGLIDVAKDGTLTPHNWQARQQKSDDVTSRTRTFRERSGNVSLGTIGNVPGTPRAGSRPHEYPDSETESEEDPPNPPHGGGNENGARDLAQDSEDADPGEPFLPPPTSEPPSMPAPEPDPAEVRRVADAVDGLFPQGHFGAKVGQFATMYPPAWILKACQAAAGSDKEVGWSYIHAILRRWQGQGGPDKTAPTSRGKFTTPALAQPPSVEQVRRERAEADRNQKPYTPDVEEIAKWRRWAEGNDATQKKIAEKCLAGLDDPTPQRRSR